MLKFKKVSGLEKRWLVNNVSIMIALAVLCVAAVTVSLTVYYYSNLRSGLEAKAKTTTDFFGNYISQSYNEYYQSCIKFAQTFEEKNTLELQFISTNGKLVASSYGQWAGESPQTSDIADAVSTQKIAVFQGKNPSTGERIMAVSSPMIYTNGEVIGVLRYVTSMKYVDRQVFLIAVVSVAAGLIFIAFMLFISSFFIRSILEPVSQITATAKRIAAGSYGVQIPKRFDDEIGELADTINDMNVDAIPTGSLALDAALGIGGVPKGRIIEIYGPESSGKTTLALHIVAQAQKRGGEVAFVDAEHALDPVYAGKIGVDIDSMSSLITLITRKR